MLKDQDSFRLASGRRVGESLYMEWTRNFDTGLGRDSYGLVFVESKTWLLRVRFFPRIRTRLIEGLEWLRTFVRRTTSHDLLEVHGDSDTPWTVPGRGRDLNSAVGDDCVIRRTALLGLPLPARDSKPESRRARTKESPYAV